MRGERWLLRLGEFLIRIASRRLPRRVRDERYREWTAELPVILHDPDGGIWPWRARRTLGYALDTIRGTTVHPRSSRYRGAHSGKPDNSWLAAAGALVALLALLALPVFIYFIVTSGASLGFWVSIWTTAGRNLASYAIARRRRTYSMWSGAEAWLSAAVMVIATGYITLIAARDSHWRGGSLRLVTLASYGTSLAGTACAGISLLVVVRLVIRRRAQQRAGVPGGPQGEGTAGT